MPGMAPLYTLQVSAESNFPGVRAISVVKKGEDAVLLIGNIIISLLFSFK